MEESKITSLKDVILGVQKDPEDTRDYLVANYLLKTEHLQTVSQMDWQSEMTPVKNQGPLGSCVAFAVNAAKEWQEKKENKLETLKTKDYDLSEQWLYYECKKIDPWPKTQGTSFRYAMQVLRKTGVPIEQGWNYDPATQGQPEKWAASVANWYKCGSYWRICSLEELKSLLCHGPIAIGITCFDEIFSPAKGVVPMPKNPKKVRGGHAICSIGFDDTSQLIKFKNSWGTSWGADGYGYISYDYYRTYCLDAWYFEDSGQNNIVNNISQQIPLQVIPIRSEKEKAVMQKIKLVNKLNQLLYVHVRRGGRDTAVPIVAKGMIAISSEELSQSPDIKDKITKGLLEKK